MLFRLAFVFLVEVGVVEADLGRFFAWTNAKFDLKFFCFLLSGLFSSSPEICIISRTWNNEQKQDERLDFFFEKENHDNPTSWKSARD